MHYMKELLRDWGLALLMGLLLFGAYQVLAPQPVSGGNAPGLRLPALQGGELSLASFDEEVIVVNFWATWCGPCRQEIPDLAAVDRSDKNVVVIGVSEDDALGLDALANASRRLGITYPVLHDRTGQAARAWGVTGFPTTFVLNQEREVVDVRMGVVDRARLEAMIARAR